MAFIASVGVVLPVYNVERYLAACLDSLLAQTVPIQEIIAVDDGSTDGSWAILQRYAAQHRCIRLIRQENRGQGAARNRALAQVQCSHVLMMDSDDLLELQAVERCLQVIAIEDPDIVYFALRRMKSDGACTQPQLYRPPGAGNTLEGLQCERMLGARGYYTCPCLYRTAFLRTNQIAYGESYIYEDHVFYVQAALCADRICLLDSPLYRYRIRTDATTAARTDSSVHVHGQLCALWASLQEVAAHARTEGACAQVLRHGWDGFLACYFQKTPRKYKHTYLRGFTDRLSSVRPSFEGLPTALVVLYRTGMIRRRWYGVVWLLAWWMRIWRKVRGRRT